MSRTSFADRAAQAVGRQLSHPSGLGGRLVGTVMGIANRRPMRALIDALDIQPESRVLDVGCGNGIALAAVPETTWCCGIDRSTTMLATARKRLHRAIAKGRVDLRRGDMLALPFVPNRFDRIIASNILYFCEDVPAFVSECRRVARPEALLGIYITSARSMAKWRFAGASTHRHFTRQQLEAELQSAGVGIGDRKISSIELPGGIEGLIAVARLI
jgi:ubiquinone/menaquinone biosynthesis C-methylase UbiE